MCIRKNLQCLLVSVIIGWLGFTVPLQAQPEQAQPEQVQTDRAQIYHSVEELAKLYATSVWIELADPTLFVGGAEQAHVFDVATFQADIERVVGMTLFLASQEGYGQGLFMVLAQQWQQHFTQISQIASVPTQPTGSLQQSPLYLQNLLRSRLQRVIWRGLLALLEQTLPPLQAQSISTEHPTTIQAHPQDSTIDAIADDANSVQELQDYVDDWSQVRKLVGRHLRLLLQNDLSIASTLETVESRRILGSFVNVWEAFAQVYTQPVPPSMHPLSQGKTWIRTITSWQLLLQQPQYGLVVPISATSLDMASLAALVQSRTAATVGLHASSTTGLQILQGMHRQHLSAMLGTEVPLAALAPRLGLTGR